MNDLEKKIEKFADLICASKNIVALTGAGMSTESGIPDFRSPESGLWNKVDPDEFASIHSYVSDSSKNVNFMLDLGLTIFKAKANKGHKALSRLQKLGKLKGILTQNIDSLHQKARTKNVVELHGTVNEAICMKCRKISHITVLVNKVLTNSPLECDECRGTLKPNAIFFGEALESDVLTAADDLIDDCDLLIILGSSLLVYPVAFYPRKAYRRGAKLAMINIQETDVDTDCEVVIHEKIGEILPKIVDLVKQKLEKN